VYKQTNNYAYIDGYNLHLSATNLGWEIDYQRLRKYLSDKYRIVMAYYFIGYLADYENLYSSLTEKGYTLIFKKVSRDNDSGVKGNVDAELVLQAMLDIMDYDQAVIVTSDGDFACLVKYLLEQGKLKRVLAPSGLSCSTLLARAAGPYIDFLDDLRNKLEYKKERNPLRTRP
jgi:uncharacterized LabA/DUF88 family protein